MNYSESLQWLDELNTFGMKLGLERIRRLVEILGHPERRYKTIHVTGTNGKGSVSAMLAAVLHEAGIKTALYTSPHLVSYTERMRIDGKDISEADFARAMTKTRAATEQMIGEGEESPTQFEVLTAAAFLYFAEQHVEYAVIEVGLGGLLDSTNVITPVLSVITNVTLEHADKCGGTLEGVAHHKAGIIKDGVPVVTAAKEMPLGVIKETAQEKRANLYVMGEDFSATWGNLDAAHDSYEVRFSSEILRDEAHGFDYTMDIGGTYQLANSAVAVMSALVVRESDKRVSMEAIRHALAGVKWPGRFENMSREIDGKMQIIRVDGSHNPAGVEELRKSLDKFMPDDEQRGRVFLMGILADKDIDSMVKILLRPCDEIVVTVPDSPRASTPEAVIEKAHRHVSPKLIAHAEKDNARALRLALSIAGGERPLIICGSLYLIGHIREMILKNERSIAP
ncbi:MAG: bifunctional folylpolyglutamate synthase/dihydrofolate synthase [Selenomonadaceae bacterium]